MDKRYAVIDLQPWTALEVGINVAPHYQPTVKYDGLPGCGFLPVFETLEEATAYMDGGTSQVLVLQVGEPVKASA